MSSYPLPMPSLGYVTNSNGINYVFDGLYWQPINYMGQVFVMINNDVVYWNGYNIHLVPTNKGERVYFADRTLWEWDGKRFISVRSTTAAPSTAVSVSRPITPPLPAPALLTSSGPPAKRLFAAAATGATSPAALKTPIASRLSAAPPSAAPPSAPPPSAPGVASRLSAPPSATGVASRLSAAAATSVASRLSAAPAAAAPPSATGVASRLSAAPASAPAATGVASRLSAAPASAPAAAAAAAVPSISPVDMFIRAEGNETKINQAIEATKKRMHRIKPSAEVLHLLGVGAPALPGNPATALAARTSYLQAHLATKIPPPPYVPPSPAEIAEAKEEEIQNMTNASVNILTPFQGNRDSVGQNLWAILDDLHVRREVEILKLDNTRETNMLAQAFYYCTHKIPDATELNRIVQDKRKEIKGKQTDISYKIRQLTEMPDFYKLGRYGIIIKKQTLVPLSDNVNNYHIAAKSGTLTPEMMNAESEARAGTGIAPDGQTKLGGWYIFAQIVDVRELTGALGAVDPCELNSMLEYDALYNNDTTQREIARRTAISDGYPITSSMLEPVSKINGLHISIHMDEKHNDQTHLKFNIGPTSYSINLSFINIGNKIGITQLEQTLKLLEAIFIKEGSFPPDHAKELKSAFYFFLIGVETYLNNFVVNEKIASSENSNRKPQSIEQSYESNPFNYNKYLKYKNKYLQLKAEMAKINL